MRVAAVLAALFVVASCSRADETPRSAGPVLDDSAGIQIVQNSAPLLTKASAWRVSPTPSLSIGLVEGEAAYVFTSVVGVLTLSDGRIVVADRMTGTIRFFDERGDFLGQTGRLGQGPGEYTSIASIFHLAGDTILAVDPVAQRITLLTPSGTLARSVFLELPPPRFGVGFLSAVGTLGDGQIVARAGSGRGFRAEDAGMVLQDSLFFFLFDRDGRYGEHLVTLPGAPRWGLEVSGSITFPYIPLTTDPSTAAQDERVVFARPGRPELLLFRDDANLDRVIRWHSEPRHTTALLDSLEEFMAGSEERDHARLRARRLLAEAPLGAALPHTRGVVIDDYGNIWVEVYRPPWDPTPTWEVFDARGSWLSSLTTPSRFRIFEIGVDYLLGVWRDELGVQYVRRYDLER